MGSDYYLSRQRKLAKEFDRTLERVRGVFARHYGHEPIEAMLQEARAEYAALIPQLPYLGGKQPFTQFLISTAWLLVLYRVLQRRGATLEQAGVFAYEASEAYVLAYPRFMRRLLRQMTFSKRYLRKLERRAIQSHQRQYPGGYVFNFVEGDGESFDYGVDYIECASVKFLTAQGAPELAPYVCPGDILFSETLGWGLSRTMTLAEGAPCCDFRFKKRGETRVAVPEPLRHYLDGRLDRR